MTHTAVPPTTRRRASLGSPAASAARAVAGAAANAPSCITGHTGTCHLSGRSLTARKQPISHAGGWDRSEGTAAKPSRASPPTISRRATTPDPLMPTPPAGTAYRTRIDASTAGQPMAMALPNRPPATTSDNQWAPRYVRLRAMSEA